MNDFHIGEEKKSQLMYVEKMTENLMRVQSEFNNPNGRNAKQLKFPFFKKSNINNDINIITFNKVMDIMESHENEWTNFYNRETRFKKLYEKMLEPNFNKELVSRKDKIKKIYNNFTKAKDRFPIHVCLKKFNLTDDFWNDKNIRYFLAIESYTVRRIIFKGFFKEFSEYMNYKMKYIKNAGYSCDYDGKSFFFNVCIFNENIIVSTKK